jgi:hypothetical protein
MHWVLIRLLVLAALTFTGSGLAQDILKHILTTGFGDMAEIKRKAEAGDRAAQAQLANALLMNFRSADALQWYAKAARQGDLESLFHAGQMLLSGRMGTPPEQSVKADPAQGVSIIFCAATNRHAGACYELYKAYKDGRGVPKDMVQAYAWLQLHVDFSPGLLPPAGKVELNNFALSVDVATSQKGKQLAALYKSGSWPVLVTQDPPPPQPASVAAPSPSLVAKPAPKPMVALKLNGLTTGGSNPLAVINGKTLAEGESARLAAKPTAVTVRCLRISADSVTVAVEGEDAPRVLQLK